MNQTFNPFSIEHQYQLFLAKVKLKESEMPLEQKTQLRRAFFAASGQMLLLLKNNLSALPEKKAVNTLEDMLQQIHVFWNAEAFKQNTKQ